MAEEEAGLSVVGKIKVGEKVPKKEGEGLVPTSYDYFIPHTKNLYYKNLFEEVYGEKPNHLEVAFLKEEHFFDRLELRNGSGKLRAFGNDNEGFELLNPKTQEWDKWDLDKVNGSFGSVESFKTAIIKKTGGSFKRALTLTLYLPEMDGCFLWDFTTKAGKSSIIGIKKNLNFVKKSTGRISMIPFLLSAKKAKNEKNHVYTIVSLIPKLRVSDLFTIKSLNGSAGNEVYLNKENIRNLKNKQNDNKEQKIINLG